MQYTYIWLNRPWSETCKVCFSVSQVSASGQMAFVVPYHIITIHEEVNKVFLLQSSIGWPAPDTKLKHYGSRPLQDPWKGLALGLWGLSSLSSPTMYVYCAPKARKAVGPIFTDPVFFGHMVVLYHNLGVHNLSLPLRAPPHVHDLSRHLASHYQTLNIIT